MYSRENSLFIIITEDRKQYRKPKVRPLLYNSRILGGGLELDGIALSVATSLSKVDIVEGAISAG